MTLNSRWYVAVRALLASSLILTCGLKLVSGHDPVAIWTPAPVYYASAITELVLAAMLLRARSAVAASLGIAIIMAVGIGVEWVRPANQHCGCAGSWLALSGPAHVMTSAVLGLLACLSWQHGWKPRHAMQRGEVVRHQLSE